jgi:hypothetical protein
MIPVEWRKWATGEIPRSWQDFKAGEISSKNKVVT